MNQERVGKAGMCKKTDSWPEHAMVQSSTFQYDLRPEVSKISTDFFVIDLLL